MRSSPITMQEFHVLNGDVLAEQVKPFLHQSNICVAREILMEGPVTSNDISEFWKDRAVFVHKLFGEENGGYSKKVVSEFDKLKGLHAPHKIFLWFEYDLFCQVNFWFTIHLIYSTNIDHELFWVRPSTQDWKGFGAFSSVQLLELKQDAYQLSQGEIQTLVDCWDAYQTNDKAQFQNTIQTASIELQFLKKVVQAHFARLKSGDHLTRPEASLIEISNQIRSKDFATIFPLFSAKEGIYGYGDLQVKKLWDTILTEHKELLN